MFLRMRLYSLSRLALYDENGYCHGEETDFGDIPDSSSSYIAVGIPEDDEDDSDGLELSL